MNKHVRIITTSRALIVNEKKELLLVKNNDSEVWFTPGGWLDGFETLEQALVREVFEELGIEIEPIKLYKIDYFQITAEQNKKWKENINKIEHYFLCRILKGEIQSTVENKNLWSDKDVGNTAFVKFFKKEELLQTNIAPKWAAEIY